MLEDTSVTMDGSDSNDTNGTITAYEWKEGNSILSTSVSFVKSDFSIGSHLITLTVTDNNGSTDTDGLYEAEDAEMSSAFTIATDESGYTGTGFVDYSGKDYVKWTVNIAAEGNYDLVFRYALGPGNRPLNISVDGMGGGTTIDFPATGSWSTWDDVRTAVPPTAGTHTIYASTTGLSGPNMDHVYYSK